MTVPSSQRRAVILTGSIGQGHASVAEACADALSASGHLTTTLDCMELLGGLGHRIGEGVFRRMLAIPPVYDAFHFSQLRAGTRLVDRMTKSATKRIVPALRNVLPADDDLLLVSVYPTGSAAAGELRSEYPGWRSVAFCTDATAHSIWLQPGIDRYLVSSPAEAGTVRQFDPAAEVRELPPPVRPAFFEVPDRVGARAELGLSGGPARPCVLLMAGGWGLGPIDLTAEALAGAGIDVLAVAGHNAAMCRRLDNVAHRAAPGTVRAFGFTPQVPLLMAASDLVVTSAGQTSHEARVIGRPQVLLDVVPRPRAREPSARASPGRGDGEPSRARGCGGRCTRRARWCRGTPPPLACVLGGGLAQAVSGGACLVVASDVFDTAEGRSLTTAHLVSATGLRLSSTLEERVFGFRVPRLPGPPFTADDRHRSARRLSRCPGQDPSGAQLTAFAEQLSRPKAAVQRDRPRIPTTSHSGTGTTAPTLTIWTLYRRQRGTDVRGLDGVGHDVSAIAAVDRRHDAGGGWRK